MLILLFAGTFLFPGNLRYTIIDIHGTQLHAEIADTPEKQALGLMFRSAIPDDFAMLFIFSTAEVRSFWMKNTRIPLDMIFLNQARQIVDMHLNVPPCFGDPCPAYDSSVPARYVVEVRGGLARKLKMKIGDQLNFVY